MKTFKFKLYRSKKTRRLDHQLWVACKVYNHAIALHRRYWKLYHKSLSKFTENERLEAPAFRHEEEKPLSFVSKIRTCYTPQYMV